MAKIKYLFYTNGKTCWNCRYHVFGVCTKWNIHSDIKHPCTKWKKKKKEY